MQKTVELDEAKRQLSKLIDDAAAGDEIVISKAGKPTARLVALEKPRGIRNPGGWKGQISIADDFRRRSAA